MLRIRNRDYEVFSKISIELTVVYCTYITTSSMPAYKNIGKTSKIFRSATNNLQLDTNCFFNVVFFSAIDDCMGLNANIAIKSEIIVNTKYILIKIISYDGTGEVTSSIVSFPVPVPPLINMMLDGQNLDPQKESFENVRDVF